MSSRNLLMAIVSVLSGCALHACSVLSHMSDCQYGVLRQSQPERCMTYAEYQTARGVQRRSHDLVDYKTAREKQRRAQDEASQKGDNQADSQYKDWIP